METTDVFCIICIVRPLSQPPPSIPVISLAPPSCLWRSSVQAHVLVHLLQMISVSVAQRYKICLPMQETRVPSLGREDPLEEETANPLQCSCWDNPMERDQQATVHNVTKSQTWLSTHTWLSGNKANHPGYPTISAVHFLDLSCNGLKSQVSHFSYPCWTKKRKNTQVGGFLLCGVRFTWTSLAHRRGLSLCVPYSDRHSWPSLFYAFPFPLFFAFLAPSFTMWKYTFYCMVG